MPCFGTKPDMIGRAGAPLDPTTQRPAALPLERGTRLETGGREGAEPALLDAIWIHPEGLRFLEIVALKERDLIAAVRQASQQALHLYIIRVVYAGRRDASDLHAVGGIEVDQEIQRLEQKAPERIARGERRVPDEWSGNAAVRLPPRVRVDRAPRTAALHPITDPSQAGHAAAGAFRGMEQCPPGE